MSVLCLGVQGTRKALPKVSRRERGRCHVQRCLRSPPAALPRRRRLPLEIQVRLL